VAAAVEDYRGCIFVLVFVFNGLIPCVWSWEAWKDKEGANKRNRILFFSGKQLGNGDGGAKHDLASEEGRREERSRRMAMERGGGRRRERKRKRKKKQGVVVEEEVVMVMVMVIVGGGGVARQEQI
jgi:hypothetical protein